MTKVSTPAIPFTFPIPSGQTKVGQRFIIKGEAPKDAVKFSVNFIEKKTQHRIFHMDFRFCCPWPHETVRNMNYPQGCWGPEERSDNPIQKGSYFKVEVKILSDRYVVFVNEKHFCDFLHRASHTIADAFFIEGNVHVCQFEMK